MTTTKNFYEQVYLIVRRIPRGQVTSYGRIAHLLGSPRAARAVGYALRALGDKRGNPAYDDVPWQRVINSQGRISITNRQTTAHKQAELLRAEGVVVSEGLQIDLAIFLWEGLHWAEVEKLLG